MHECIEYLDINRDKLTFWISCGYTITIMLYYNATRLLVCDGGEIYMPAVLKNQPFDLANQAAEWLNSDDGSDQAQKSIEEAKEVASELKKARQVEYTSFHTPFSV